MAKQKISGITYAASDFFAGIKRMSKGLPRYRTDWVGYESLLRVIKRDKIYELEGDVVDIGAFLGGGTAKLAKFFGKYDKKVYAIDVFDPTFDANRTEDGTVISSIYLNVLAQKPYHALQGRGQYEIYKEVTKKYSNIITIIGDSKYVSLPCEKLCFTFIDGCHDADHVKSDFNLVWPKTVSGGIVGYHDYGVDMPQANPPQVAEAIDELLETNKDDIQKIERIEKNWVILLKKN
jgi:SAM-dependent methyltransferase